MRRPDFRIKQDTFLTPFSYLTANVSTEDERHIVNLMIKDYELEIIIMSLLLIASSDGPMKQNDKKLITDYFNKYYKSRKIKWTKKVQESSSYIPVVGEYDILKEAVSKLNSTNKYVWEFFFNSFSGFNPSLKNEVVGLWYELAKNSQKKINILVSLHQKVFM